MYFKIFFKNLFLTKMEGHVQTYKKKINKKRKVNVHLVGYVKEYNKV